MAKINWNTATPQQAQDMVDFLGAANADAASMGLDQRRHPTLVEEDEDPRNQKDKKANG